MRQTLCRPIRTNAGRVRPLKKGPRKVAPNTLLALRGRFLVVVIALLLVAARALV